MKASIERRDSHDLHSCGPSGDLVPSFRARVHCRAKLARAERRSRDGHAEVSAVECDRTGSAGGCAGGRTSNAPVPAPRASLCTDCVYAHIVRGYEKTGRALDAEGAQAVRLMDAFLSDPAHRLDLWVERGQIQVLNNRVIVHGRTPYQDAENPEEHRHLVRLWLRAGDRRHFRG